MKIKPLHVVHGSTLCYRKRNKLPNTIKTLGLFFVILNTMETLSVIPFPGFVNLFLIIKSMFEANSLAI